MIPPLLIAAALVVLNLSAAVVLRGAKALPDGVADTAIVPGAAAYGDQPSPVFAGRLAHAAELHAAGRVRRIVVTGGRSTPLDPSEGAVGVAWLAARGVPPHALIAEEASVTTRQNMAGARRLLGPDAAGRVLIVTDPLHAARAAAMARAEGFDAEPAPTPHTRFRGAKVRAIMLVREAWLMLVFRVTGQ